ncbi:MAG: hypothetical protein ACOCZS_05005, partial [Verrucomicrobiota bacterium]
MGNTWYPINVVDYNVKNSFSRELLSHLVDHKIGILAMKTLADGRFFYKKTQNGNVKWDTESPLIPEIITIEEALGFVWSLPV